MDEAASVLQVCQVWFNMKRGRVAVAAARKKEIAEESTDRQADLWPLNSSQSANTAELELTKQPLGRGPAEIHQLYWSRRSARQSAPNLLLFVGVSIFGREGANTEGVTNCVRIGLC